MNPIRRLILMLIALGAFCALAISFNYAVNPYGAWRIRLVDPFYREDADARLMTPYLIRTVDPRMLIVGSSRVRIGMRIKQGYHDGVLNGALQGAGAEEAAAVVRAALKKPKLKVIVWDLDFFAFNHNFALPDHDTMARLEGDPWRTFTETLLNLGALDASRMELNRAIHGREVLGPEWSLPIPWPQPYLCKALGLRDPRSLDRQSAAQIQTELIHYTPDYTGYSLAADRVKEYADTVAEARRRGIQVIPFVPPISAYVLEMIRQSGQWNTFQRWKVALLAGGPYWDFSGYNRFDLSPELFGDVLHFKTVVGHQLLRRLLGLDCAGCDNLTSVITNAGQWVDNETICGVLARQDEMMRDATAEPNRFTARASAALAARGFSPAALMAREGPPWNPSDAGCTAVIAPGAHPLEVR